MEQELGERIAERIDALVPSVTRKSFAWQIGMPPDALSRALRGQRGISSAELVRIAQVLDADIHELVTGAPDPRRVTLAARHDFDQDTRTRSVPSFDDDTQTLENIRIAYAQAALSPQQLSAAPSDPTQMRELLGDDFARPFLNRVEQKLGIDVIRAEELGTAYTMDIGGRKIIAIPAKGNWFRENWDIAHELAHLAGIESEADANAYASELLLPEALVTSVDWENASPQTVADVLWETGVSTEALRNRLDALHLRSSHVRVQLADATQKVLRQARSWSHSAGDAITERMDAAAHRRFPLELQEAHEQKIEAGEIGPAFLAWMRGVGEQWIADAYEPRSTEASVNDLAEAFGVDIT